MPLKEYTDVIGSLRSISSKYTNSTNQFCVCYEFFFLFLLLLLLYYYVFEGGIFSTRREEANRKVVHSRKHFIMNFVSGRIG